MQSMTESGNPNPINLKPYTYFIKQILIKNYKCMYVRCSYELNLSVVEQKNNFIYKKEIKLVVF